ncbi:MAG: transketolase [Bacteroidales bacterium]|nr:transketolase [Bacteroidales bacterium]
MFEITRINARSCSLLGQRGAIFGLAALEAAREDEKFVLLTADLATLSGMTKYIDRYPDRFHNVGIAEQNMIGIAAGLAAEGFHPCATTYATFITMRSCEQIRHFCGYMKEKIIVVGSGAGLSQGFAGNTHYTMEDLAVMRSIPNMTIMSPADGASAVKQFELARTAEGAVYMRLTGNLNCPMVYKDDVSFEIGKANLLKEGHDVVIFAVGTMVSTALKAATLLEGKGIGATVYDLFSVKPVDREAILSAKQYRLAVTVEEHNKMGGLGAAVAEVMTGQTGMPKLLRCGIHDRFDTAGDYEGLLAQNKLTPELLAEDITSAVNK